MEAITLSESKRLTEQLEELVTRWIEAGTKDQLETLAKAMRHSLKNLESVIDSI